MPKNELLDTIWGDRFVSESALTSRVKAARQAIGDDGRGQRLIRTVHGRGYQFIGPVSETPQVTVLPVAADPPPQEIRPVPPPTALASRTRPPAAARRS